MGGERVETQLWANRDGQRTATADIIYEGWVHKESKHLGAWRRRWLVLFRDQRSQLPVLCSFKASRTEWAAESAAPKATCRLVLVGMACMPVQASLRVREHVFWLQGKAGDFFFSAGTAAEAIRWTRAIGECIADAALRLGGHPAAEEGGLVLGGSPYLSSGSSAASPSAFYYSSARPSPAGLMSPAGTDSTPGSVCSSAPGSVGSAASSMASSTPCTGPRHLPYGAEGSPEAGLPPGGTPPTCFNGAGVGLRGVDIGAGVGIHSAAGPSCAGASCPSPSAPAAAPSVGRGVLRASGAHEPADPDAPKRRVSWAREGEAPPIARSASLGSVPSALRDGGAASRGGMPHGGTAAAPGSALRPIVGSPPESPAVAAAAEAKEAEEAEEAKEAEEAEEAKSSSAEAAAAEAAAAVAARAVDSALHEVAARERAESEGRERALSEQNAELARQVKALESTLENVVLSEINAEIEALEEQEEELALELAAAREEEAAAAAKAAEEAAAAKAAEEEEAAEAAVAAVEAAAEEEAAAEPKEAPSLDAMVGSDDEVFMDAVEPAPADEEDAAAAAAAAAGQGGESVAGGAEVDRGATAELEQALASLRLSLHILRDQQQQLVEWEAMGGEPPSGRSSANSNGDDGYRSAHFELGELGEVDFLTSDLTRVRYEPFDSYRPFVPLPSPVGSPSSSSVSLPSRVAAAAGSPLRSPAPRGSSSLTSLPSRATPLASPARPAAGRIAVERGSPSGLGPGGGVHRLAESGLAAATAAAAALRSERRTSI